MRSHILLISSGGQLDLNNLPEQATVEMLQVCRDRIFALESRGADKQPKTPIKRRASAEPASSSKAMKPAQILKEKKSIVKEIKKRITPLKFHDGWDKIEREVKFSADRLSPQAAEQLLQMPRDSWSTATVSANLESDNAMGALSIAPGELTGSVWRKGGAMRGRRFGAVKALRLGSAPLLVKSLKLSYTIKSQRLVGSLICVNCAGIASSRKRCRLDDEDFFSDPSESDAEGGLSDFDFS